MRLPWGLRWWELLPEAVLAVGLGLFFATETSAALSAFKSRTAVVLMVAAGLLWLVARVVLVRFTRWPALRVAVFGLAALGVLWIVVFPAYDNKTVVEALPGVAPAAAVTVPATTVPATTLPPAPAAATPTVAAAPAPPSAPAPAVPPAAETTAAATGPVRLGSAPIRGIDHRASGDVVLYRQPDDSLVVGLERIDIQPGPDYDVYLVPGPDRRDTDGGTRLDDLRGNKGTQYYVVPEGVDVTPGQWTLLVWCQTFDVPVAGATPV